QHSAMRADDDAGLLMPRYEAQASDDPAMWAPPAHSLQSSDPLSPEYGQALASIPAMIPRRSVRSVTASGNVELSDDIILVDATSAAVTMTLPALARAGGKAFTLKKIDASANDMVIDGDSAETIDGAANIT